MAIGMTYDEFWYKDPRRVIAYRDAYEIKRRMLEAQLHKQGLYNYHALCDVAPSFALKPQQPTPYLDEPFPVSEKEKKERDELKRIEHFFNMKARIENFMKRRGGS